MGQNGCFFFSRGPEWVQDIYFDIYTQPSPITIGRSGREGRGAAAVQERVRSGAGMGLDGGGKETTRHSLLPAKRV